MPLVVGAVLGAVGRVQLRQARDAPLDRARGRQVEHQRPDLGTQEVVGAGRAERGELGVPLAGQEVQHDIAVGEVADLGASVLASPRMTGASAAARASRSASGSGSYPSSTGARTAPAGRVRPGRPARVRMIASEFASHSSLVSPHAVMPWPPRITPIACGFSAAIAAMSSAELEAGPPPRHPLHAVAEDLLGQRLAIDGRGDRDARVGVQVVDVRRVDQAVHRGVDRRGRATLAVQAVGEGSDHLVLAVDAGVDVGERAQAVQPQHRQARLGQRAEVTAGPLDPQQFGGLAGHRVGRGALGRGVAARVVRVRRVGAEPVAPRQQIGVDARGVTSCAPPGRLATRPRGDDPLGIPGPAIGARPDRDRGPARSRSSASNGRTSVL